MSDKIAKKTKAELHEMLAQAVRNTQPQPVRIAQPGQVSDVQPEPKRKTQPHKTRPAPKHTAKIKSVRASASRKQRRR
jgi:hypothetical protein